ncbi:hypothetical protein TTHERM_001169489 (macronuclear) [Tetrahymena thermophila SB210]|uniref:Uncharacterized protein n=1 Tax=Tetrahymena thermophila (strain SB210) TaxID=312017 RepID=W7XHY8_TETTS|nr:hypothetical protein TTHERM_001169489 [Tetrahymena thermophila SB210]EWS74181.1 hypothetical protein TTHERM_001169489 [Tetrahymena thermophila SB210]|eukprot:XP_012653288.1 hypothetical protein TTHERM_001169489 [Tetrahymena thermophila SB210]
MHRTKIFVLKITIIYQLLLLKMKKSFLQVNFWIKKQLIYFKRDIKCLMQKKFRQITKLQESQIIHQKLVFIRKEFKYQYHAQYQLQKIKQIYSITQITRSTSKKVYKQLY